MMRDFLKSQAFVWGWLFLVFWLESRAPGAGMAFIALSLGFYSGRVWERVK